MAGQIVKAKFDDPFARIPNEFLQNKNISARAKGVLSYILSLPSDWVIYKTYLHTNFLEGRDAICKAFDELIKLGYIVEVKKVDPKTMRFKGVDYMVYSYPITENPKTEIPKTETKVLPKKLKTNKQYTNTPISPKGEEEVFDELGLSIEEWVDSYLNIHKKFGVYRTIEDINKQYLGRKLNKWQKLGLDNKKPLKALYNILGDRWEREHKYPSAALTKLFNIDNIARWANRIDAKC